MVGRYLKLECIKWFKLFFIWLSSCVVRIFLFIGKDLFLWSLCLCRIWCKEVLICLNNWLMWLCKCLFLNIKVCLERMCVKFGLCLVKVSSNCIIKWMWLSVFFFLLKMWLICDIKDFLINLIKFLNIWVLFGKWWYSVVLDMLICLVSFVVVMCEVFLLDLSILVRVCRIFLCWLIFLLLVMFCFFFWLLLLMNNNYVVDLVFVIKMKFLKCN